MAGGEGDRAGHNELARSHVASIPLRLSARRGERLSREAARTNGVRITAIGRRVATGAAGRSVPAGGARRGRWIEDPARRFGAASGQSDALVPDHARPGTGRWSGGAGAPNCLRIRMAASVPGRDDSEVRDGRSGCRGSTTGSLTVARSRTCLVSGTRRTKTHHRSPPVSKLFEQLQFDLNASRKAQDKPRTLLIGTTVSEVKNRRIELRRDLTEDEVVEVLRSEEHTSELQSRENLVCRLLLE